MLKRVRCRFALLCFGIEPAVFAGVLGLLAVQGVLVLPASGFTCTVWYCGGEKASKTIPEPSYGVEKLPQFVPLTKALAMEPRTP